MNTIYRIVWNVTLGKWVVASELAKGRKKKSSAKIAVLALALAGLGAPAAFAAETDSPEQTEKAVVAEESDFTITPFFAIGGGDDGGRTDTVAIGSGARALTMNSVALGSNALAGIGADGNAVGVNQVAIGTSANAQANTGIAIGQEAKALGKTGATAIGFRATAYASDDPLVAAWSATAMGTHAEANGDGAAALGDSAKAKGDRTAAFGRGASAEQNDATAFGAGTDINATGGTAIGSGAQVATGAIDGVAIGKDSVANRGNAVSVGSSATKRQIINVDVGTQDTDAVNLSQLKGTAQSVANALGGGASVNSDGTVKAPTYTVADIANGGNKTVNNVGDALGQLNANTTNLDGRVTTNEGDIIDIRNQLGNGSIGLVQQDATSRDITVAAGTDGGRVDFTGTAGARKLAGVADGALSSTSKEAVNGSQLFATNERVTKNEGDIIAIDGRVTRNEGDIVTIGDRVTSTETNITNLDGRVTKNEGDIVNIDGRVTTNEGDIIDIRNQLGNGSIGLVQQDATSRDITVAAGTDGGRVDFAGTAGARKLAGVAEGELSSSSSEAVNGSQLFATNERVTKNEGDIVNLDGRVTKNEGDIINLGDRINSGSVGLVRQAGANASVTVAAATGGTVVDLTGTDGTRQIKGVSEGTDDTDAVNVGQLKKAGLVGGDGSTLDAVVYDAGSNRGSVTFGGLGGTKLTNVMAGIVSATSTDAVNGSQLWILQDQVGKLGDRVTNIEINGAPVPGPAPEGRDPAFAANGDGGPATATGKDSVAAGTGAKASADNSVAIGAGSVADRADTVSVGSVGHERVVSNVAAGEQRTDAANWGQVQDALATANRYTDDRFDGVNRRIGEVQRQANRGIAASAALINVTPYMPGKTVLNAGVANYRGESALGVGVSRWNDTGRVNFNAGVSAAAGDSPIFRMGVGVVLGD